MKSKTGNSTVEAFENIFEESPDRVPRKLWVDLGKEFYNKSFQEFLDKNEIEIYSTYNAPDERSNYGSHNPVIERFNRTIKNWMYKKFTERGNRIWIDILPELIDKYNNKIHRSIKVSPKEASDNPDIINERNTNNNNENNDMLEKQKYNVNDKVRIFKFKTKFEKGVTYKWSKEIFVISEVCKTKPITYRIKDLDGEDILGKFYTSELQHSTFSQ
jgi:hypothetical protein